MPNALRLNGRDLVELLSLSCPAFTYSLLPAPVVVETLTGVEPVKMKNQIKRDHSLSLLKA